MVPPQRKKWVKSSLVLIATLPWKKWAKSVPVLIAFGLLIVNIFQMNATKQAAEVASESIRPRLTIVGLSPQSLTGSNPLPLDHGKLHVWFQVPNYGPMPASHIRIRRFENVSTWNQAKRLPYGQPIWDYPQMLFPTTSTGAPGWGMTGDREISEEEIKGLSSHDLVATFSILVEYDDTSGATHGVEYCEQFTFPPIFNRPCPWPVRMD
jgi:hypothetical protein